MLLSPRLQSVVMAIAGFQLTKRFRVGYVPTVVAFDSKEMVEHLVVDDAPHDVSRYVALVQNWIDADGFGCLGVTGELNGPLPAHLPVHSPGNLAVHLVVKVFPVDLVKEFFQIEKTSRRTQYGSPRLWGSSSDLVGVCGDEISQHGWCLFAATLDIVCQ